VIVAVVLALPLLFDACVARFALDAAAADPPVVPIVQSFGWREPAKNLAPVSSRIVWVPGDDKTGELGAFAPPRYPGRNPRPLATLVERFTVYVSGRDSASAEDERAQYQATRELFDAWVRAVYLAAHGTVALERPSWVIEKALRRFGAAIRVSGTVQAVIPDAPWAEVVPVGADIDTGYSDDEAEHVLVPFDETPLELELVSAPVISVENGGELVEGSRLFWTLAVFENETTATSYLVRNGIATVIAAGDSYTVTAADVVDEASFLVRTVATGEGGPITSDSGTVSTSTGGPTSLESIVHYWSLSRDVTSELDDDVAQVDDQVGADHLAQTDEASKPDLVAAVASLGGKPASLHGVGGRTYLRKAVLAAPLAQPFTVWAVVSVPTAPDWNGYKSILGSVSNRWFVRANGGSQIEINAGGGALGIGPISMTNATRYGIIAVFNGSQSKIRVNGVTIYAGAGAVGSNPLTDFILGDEMPGGLHFTGHIAEAGACSGDLIADISELGILEEWIAQEY
jgi:hypothetical protein